MLNNYLSDLRIIKKYINHNNHIFKKKEHNNQIFLVEFNGWQGIQIALSYLANVFSRKNKCKIVAFDSYSLFHDNKNNFLNKIKWNIGKLFKIKNFGVYSSFGVTDFIKPKYDSSIEKSSLKKVEKFFKKKKNLKDLENFRIENIWIGDLIYDSYLKKFSTHTIDLDSKKFKLFFFECLCNFHFWSKYFKKNNIKGIAVGHSVYVSGIPLRIADYYNISNFSFEGSNFVNGTGRTSFKKRENHSGGHFRYYRKLFKKFNRSQAKKNIALGQKYLKELIQGKKIYYYLEKTAFPKKNYNINYFKKSKKIKVVIFSHVFSDSPHVFGNHFFPDFNEWFKFLEKIVQQTNYDWYLKPHPQEDKMTKKIVRLFIKNNPSIKLLPKNLSNSYIARKKIDFALTVYGTIGSELPGYGIKLINASKNNPTFGYNFCINPKNFNEYKKTLLNLKKINFKINKKDLFEFHYMKRHYSDFDNFLFTDLDKYFKFNNQMRRNILTNRCYKYWLEDFSAKRHKIIIKMFENFIKSGDYMITNSHLE